MLFKTKIEEEKTKLLAELQAFETKAKEDLAKIEAKAKEVFDIKDEIKSVESKISADVKKVEKWFVTAFKSQTQVTPTTDPVPVVENTTPVVEPTANTEAK